MVCGAILNEKPRSGITVGLAAMLTLAGHGIGSATNPVGCCLFPEPGLEL
jgi:hypothetical protein